MWAFGQFWLPMFCDCFNWSASWTASDLYRHKNCRTSACISIMHHRGISASNSLYNHNLFLSGVILFIKQFRVWKICCYFFFATFLFKCLNYKIGNDFCMGRELFIKMWLNFFFLSFSSVFCTDWAAGIGLFVIYFLRSGCSKNSIHTIYGFMK